MILSAPMGLEDSSKYPNLVAHMLRRGWTETDVKKVVALNILRVLARAQQVTLKTSHLRLEILSSQ